MIKQQYKDVEELFFSFQKAYELFQEDESCRDIFTSIGVNLCRRLLGVALTDSDYILEKHLEYQLKCDEFESRFDSLNEKEFGEYLFSLEMVDILVNIPL